MSKEKPHLVPSAGGNSAGRVKIDGRGRNVWHWEDSQLDSTTILLRRLDNDALELEPTRSVPIPGGADRKAGGRDGAERSRRRRSAAGGDDPRLGIDVTMPVDTSAGFDPYNNA